MGEKLVYYFQAFAICLNITSVGCRTLGFLSIFINIQIILEVINTLNNNRAAIHLKIYSVELLNKILNLQLLTKFFLLKVGQKNYKMKLIVLLSFLLIEQLKQVDDN